MSTTATSSTTSSTTGPTTDSTDAVERVHADHASVRRLGHWSSADRFEVRARHASVVLDLRSPSVPAEIEVRVDLRRATLKLLVPDDAAVEHWDLDWTGRGRVKDWQAPAGPSSRRIRLLGTARSGEVRVNRGGVAIVSAMLSREYLDDVLAARREGRMPVVDDPGRAV